MAFNGNWHGWAQQTNWIEVPPSGAGGYPSEHNAPGPLTSKKFAEIVYNIAPAPPPSLPSQIPVSSLAITEVYVDGDDAYICEAPINSNVSDSVWRVTKISKNITGGATARYANGGSAALAATSLVVVKTYTYT